MENSCIGNFISIITREEVRIEGILSHLNLQESLIILSNATCYGSEGREMKKRSEILPCHQLQGYVHIRGREIRDLELIFLPRKLTEQETEFPLLSRAHVHRSGVVA